MAKKKRQGNKPASREEYRAVIDKRERARQKVCPQCDKSLIFSPIKPGGLCHDCKNERCRKEIPSSDTYTSSLP